LKKRVKSAQNDVVKFEAKLTTFTGSGIAPGRTTCDDLVEFSFATGGLFIIVDGTIMAVVVVVAAVVVVVVVVVGIVVGGIRMLL
jgi:hypothetical protein